MIEKLTFFFLRASTCLHTYIYRDISLAIEIRMNGLDETVREYVQIEEDGKALSMTDTHIHT